MTLYPSRTTKSGYHNHDTETDASHCLTLSMAQHAAIQFAECKPLAEIDEACLDALSAVITAELQARDFNQPKTQTQKPA